MYVNTLSSLHLTCSKLHLLFIEFCITCRRLKHCSPHRLLLSSFSIPSSSLLPSMFNVFLCLCVCVYLSVGVFFFFCGWASVSPCWQKGITAPGIESSSQAFGWRSTSQMKRMLVHLKVVAELPVDVFAVTLSVISNPGWFGFLFRGFIQYLYIRV